MGKKISFEFKVPPLIGNTYSMGNLNVMGPCYAIGKQEEKLN